MDTDKIQSDTIKFEVRKEDHLRLALDRATQSEGQSGLDEIELIHEALPDLNFDEVDISTMALGHTLRSPFLVSSMTAGHPGAGPINTMLAEMAQEFGWLMGVGSQRRQLMDRSSGAEWTALRKVAPDAKILGNLGITQLITSQPEEVASMAADLGAIGMIIHTNPLQEVLQPEGTPQFKGGLQALERFCKHFDRPVVLKEVGCGFSGATLSRLRNIGLAAVDISGRGGTHWGRLEGLRSPERSIHADAAITFKNWGHPTVASLRDAVNLKLPFEVWASGGVRTGLDGAKLLALGAGVVGLAQPLLKAALQGAEELRRVMEGLEFELKCALFCTGSKDLSQLREKHHADGQ